MPSAPASARRERPDRRTAAREVRRKGYLIVAEPVPEPDPEAVKAVLAWIAGRVR